MQKWLRSAPLRKKGKAIRANNQSDIYKRVPFLKVLLFYLSKQRAGVPAQTIDKLDGKR